MAISVHDEARPEIPERLAAHRGGRDDGLHALSWVVWALAGVAAVQLAPSPPMVLVTMAVAALVVLAHGQVGPLTRAFPILLAVATTFVALRVLLTGLTTQSTDWTLVTLPSVDLPRILGGFTLGGPMSTQAVLGSLAEGAAIIGVIGVFGAFTAVIRHVDLVRAAPRAFHEVGLVITVALAFVPALVSSMRDVRDAEVARTGGAGRRRGRITRSLVPVLEGALEQALSLSETLDARGLGHARTSEAERRAAVLTAAGLICGVAAFGALVGRARGVALALGAVGALCVVIAVGVASRGTGRPRYRPRPLRTRDIAVGLGAIATPVGLAVLAGAGSEGLRWFPSVALVPPVDPLALVCLVGLGAPVLVRRDEPAVDGPVPVGSPAASGDHLGGQP